MASLAMMGLTTLLMATGTALAQDSSQEDSEQKWYQIEVFIFAYQEAAASNTEVWPKEMGLKYPQRIVELKQAAQTEVLLNDWSGHTDATTEVLPEAESSATNTSATNTSATQTPATEALAPIAEAAAEQILLPEPIMVTLQEQPFTLLAKDELSFAEIKQKLLRQRDLRQLFHGAWRQPIGKRNDSESLLIRGGDQFDNHFELEGSISLGLERYLHITTDLWLSTFVSNAGRLQNPWPVLPKAPVTSSASSGIAETNDSNQDVFNQSNLAANSGTLFVNNNDMENPFLDLAGNQYAVEQTATMRQSRRMRSNELHYIDHPLMGLLVRITPYEFPETVETEFNEAGGSNTELIEAQPAQPSAAP
ncbi:hypothetical protein BST96_16560 [Oceanicoccus sagamiensis]|uniref:Peptidoglycan-binding protein CsiV n=1 Tax=Oceanicoccus sagamiensis TaxID=716816 RepID=A0A1X9NEU5_9GAMM|nr:hypothetical protein BST96_16560 [Oceanicoccus sagamiensis]